VKLDMMVMANMTATGLLGGLDGPYGLDEPYGLNGQRVMWTGWDILVKRTVDWR
jgi:hypothetical protein